MATQEQLDSFHHFATRQLSNGTRNLTVAELFDLWQVQNIRSDDLVQSVQSVKDALTDMEAGDTGKPLEEFSAEMRSHYGIAKNQ